MPPRPIEEQDKTTSQSNKKKKQQRPLPDKEGMGTAPMDLQATQADRSMATEAQSTGAALSRKSKEAITHNSDAMEEDVHSIIHIGSPSESSTSTKLSTFSISSLSSSSSDSSSQDTQELVKKIHTNLKPKDLTKTERSGGSKLDSASHQSSGQDLGYTSGHIPVASSGNTSDVSDAAGAGD
jgi:hypothetical protein